MASTINADNGVSSGSAGLKSSADSSGALALQTNGTVAVTVDTSQNVGVGATTAPLSAQAGRIYLAIKGTGTAAGDGNGIFQLQTNSAGSTLPNIGNIEWNLPDNTSSSTTRVAYISVSAEGATANNRGSNMSFATKSDGVSSSGALRMLIDSSGNVGIGTVSPTSKLDVATSINLGLNYLNVAYDIGGGSGWLGGYNVTYSGGVKNVNLGTASVISYQSGGVVFYTNVSAAAGTTAPERARITSDGFLLVGTTTTTPSAPFGGVIFAGTFKTIVSSGGVANGASATLFTITVDSAYLVTAQTQNASGLSVTAIVRYVTGGNPVAVTVIAVDNGNFTITISGTAVRITNNLGGTVVYSHSSMRIF